MINANLINLSTIIQDLLLLLFIKIIIIQKIRKNFEVKENLKINFLAISNIEIFDI